MLYFAEKFLYGLRYSFGLLGESSDGEEEMTIVIEVHLVLAFEYIIDLVGIFNSVYSLILLGDSMFLYPF